MRLQKWYSSVFPSLDKVPAGSCLSSSCFKISQWVSFTYGLGSFQSVAVALDLRASVFALEHIKGRSSISYISMIRLVLNSIDFQSHMFWGLVFPVQGRVLYFGISPDCGVTTSGMGSQAGLCLRFSYPSGCVIFCPLLWRHCSSSSWVLFRGKFFSV